MSACTVSVECCVIGAACSAMQARWEALMPQCLYWVAVHSSCTRVMHKTGSHPALLRWLQKHLKGLRHAAEAFHAFLKSSRSGHCSSVLKSARRSVVTSLRAGDQAGSLPVYALAGFNIQQSCVSVQRNCVDHGQVATSFQSR